MMSDHGLAVNKHQLERAGYLRIVFCVIRVSLLDSWLSHLQNITDVEVLLQFIRILPPGPDDKVDDVQRRITKSEGRHPLLRRILLDDLPWV